MDEVHAAKDGSLYDVLSSRQDTRDEPLFIMITTAGKSQDCFAYRQREYYKSILSGVVENERIFSVMYTYDKEWENDWTNPKYLMASNPNLGYSVKTENIMDKLRTAVQNPEERSGIIQETLNIWQGNGVIDKKWLDSDLIDSAFADFSITDDKFKNQQASCAYDLGSTDDCTSVAFCIYIEEEDKYYFFFNHYLPEAMVASHRQSEQYKKWSRMKYLKLGPGNVNDENFVYEDIVKFHDIIQIGDIRYDETFAKYLASRLNEYGFNCFPFSQRVAAFAPLTYNFEKLIKSDKIRFQKNEMTRWMFNNAGLKEYESNGNNRKPVKIQAHRKIDGVIACLMALYPHTLILKQNKVI
jgi:phage terminase large subunit-like protein